MNNILNKLRNMSLGKNILFAFTIGITVGILTVLGQGILPNTLLFICNSGAFWIAPAFFVAALGLNKRNAIVGAIIALLGMVMGYYAYAMLIQKIPHSIYFITVWSGVAIIGGIIFGLGGFFWGRDRSSVHKFGSALIGGVFIIEGLYYTFVLYYISNGIIEIIIGLFLVLVLECSKKERISSLLALIPIVFMGIIGYTILYYLTI